MMKSVFKHPFWAILGYALVLGVATVLIRNLELRWLVMKPSLELYSGALALLFLILGIWLARKLNEPRKESIESQPAIAPTVIDPEKALQNGLSERELEVLKGMAEGLSNAEIGERLFLSTHTVKSHASRLFEKLDVKRRTQAIQKGKALGIIEI
jgi:DNA-binding CsgD family transcriptional regulator